MSFHNWAEGAAGTFQRGSLRITLQPGDALQKLRFEIRYSRNSRSAQQAWMYSRNQTTIASALKHRQLVFLHPTDVSNEEAKQNARLNENNPCGRGFEILRKKRSAKVLRTTAADSRLAILYAKSRVTDVPAHSQP